MGESRGGEGRSEASDPTTGAAAAGRIYFLDELYQIAENAWAVSLSDDQGNGNTYHLKIEGALATLTDTWPDSEADAHPFGVSRPDTGGE